MKYLAKHPDQAAYELTPEEMISPRLKGELLISDEWIVRVGDKWVPIQDFLGGKLPPASTLAPAKPEAPLTPKTAFAVALRILGVCLLTVFAYGCWSALWTVTFHSDVLRLMPASVIGRAIGESLFFLIAGAYLLTGAPSLVRWAFQSDRS